MSIVIKAENISKLYRLGTYGTGSLGQDINRWWAGVRGKEDPHMKIGAINKQDEKSSEGYVWSLKDINFDTHQGEVLGIIGKNGAGKSTLLKILSRVTAPTTGMVKIKGRVASLLEVGTGFHPELTGRENIFLNGAVMGMTKTEIKRKFDEIVDFSGVARYIDTPVKRYSSGMYVRLAFAVAAHLEPEILIVDEVLAVGDAEFQKKCLGKMKDVSKNEGRTVLFVSHNMVALENLSTRCILLKNGRLAEEGKPKEVIGKYLNASEYIATSNLGERTDRTGTGEVKVTGVLMKNKDGKATDTIPMGEKFSVDITYKGQLTNGIIAVMISNNFIEVITEANSFHSSNSNVDLTSGKATCEFEHNTLITGTYYITTYIARYKELVDHLVNCHEFEVESADVYGTGKIQELGLFYTNHKWSF